MYKYEIETFLKECNLYSQSRIIVGIGLLGSDKWMYTMFAPHKTRMFVTHSYFCMHACSYPLVLSLLERETSNKSHSLWILWREPFSSSSSLITLTHLALKSLQLFLLFLHI